MSETIASFTPLIRAFDTLEIPYSIGGSVGSSHYGRYRATQDTDIVADLRPRHAGLLCDLLEGQYYYNDQSIKQAIAGRSCFNVIHLATSLKVDVFLLKTDAYDRQAFSRRRAEPLDPDSAELLFVSAPEDIVLHKLYWFRLGGEVSERQWSDVLGVLRVQADALDDAYLNKWAAEIRVGDLLETIRRQAADA